jgi:hypothetical protein
MSASAVFALLVCLCAAASGFTLLDFDSCKYHFCFSGEYEVENKGNDSYRLLKYS